METQICIFQQQASTIILIATVTGWRGPSADDSNGVCLVNCYGYVSYGNYNYAGCAARPVVSIPRSEVNIDVNTSGSTPTLSLVKVEE